LNDIGIINTNRLFSERLKRYYEKVISQSPDTLIKEADWLISRTMPNKDNFRFVTHHLTYWTETSKIMGTDAVFVHLIKTYYKTGQASWLDEKQLAKVIERADILEPLLIGKVVPDLELIDTIGIRAVQKLGMDTTTSSERLTKLYYDNIGNLQKLFINLKKIKADYTVLLFWDVDCGHCKKEVPIILETYHKMKKEGISMEVFAVYTQHEYDKWKKFIKENKLDWINVADGVHLHNLKKKFDIFSTPVIYLLDKDKKIKAKRIGAEQIEEVIKAFMKMEKK
jgi:thiol-disulfide isomerase/thioredoxin